MSRGATRQWHHLAAGPSGGAPGKETAADARVDASSAWFDGHFPGLPVLPGIAQLAMVRDVVAGVMGPDVRVSEIRRIRFKRKIGPGERLSVIVSPQRGAGAFSFRILAGNAVACTGTMVVEASNTD